MKKTLLSLALAALSSPAFANSPALEQLLMTVGKTSADLNKNPASAPAAYAAPPQQAIFPTWAQVQDAFNHASAPSLDALQGTWIHTGTLAKDQGVTDAWSYQDEYDGHGIKNSDGSDHLKLFFAPPPIPIRNGAKMTVSLQNLGDKNTHQGTYNVTFRPHAACFSRYGYINDVVNTSVYYSYECRSPKASSGHFLICTVSLQTKNAKNVPEAKRPYIGQVILFLIHRPQSEIRKP